MAIILTANLEPAGNFPIVTTEVVSGGYQTVATIVDRDAITTVGVDSAIALDGFRREGMLVYVQATGDTYRLAAGLTNADWVLVDPITAADYTAKGVILVGTGVGTEAALPVGIDGLVLTADSAEATGVKWVAGGGGGGIPTPAVVVTNLYVSGLNGNDINDGSTPLLAVATLARAWALIPYTLAAPIVVHLGAAGAPGVPYAWSPMPAPAQLTPDARIWLYGDGAGQVGEDGFVVAAGSPVAAIAGTDANQITTAAIVADAYQGFTLEVVDGPAAGYRRTILTNTASSIVPVRRFETEDAVTPVTPVAGNTIRILRPSVIFSGYDTAGNADGIPGLFSGIGNGDGGAPLLLVNLAFASVANQTEINRCTLFGVGIEFRGTVAPIFTNCNGSFGNWDNVFATAANQGSLPQGTNLSVAKTSWFTADIAFVPMFPLALWRGWGVSQPDVVVVSAATTGLRFLSCQMSMFATVGDLHGSSSTLTLGGRFWGDVTMERGFYQLIGRANLGVASPNCSVFARKIRTELCTVLAAADAGTFGFTYTAAADTQWASISSDVQMLNSGVFTSTLSAFLLMTGGGTFELGVGSNWVFNHQLNQATGLGLIHVSAGTFTVGCQFNATNSLVGAVTAAAALLAEESGVIDITSVSVANTITGNVLATVANQGILARNGGSIIATVGLITLTTARIDIDGGTFIEAGGITVTNANTKPTITLTNRGSFLQTTGALTCTGFVQSSASNWLSTGGTVSVSATNPLRLNDGSQCVATATAGAWSLLSTVGGSAVISIDSELIVDSSSLTMTSLIFSTSALTGTNSKITLTPTTLTFTLGGITLDGASEMRMVTSGTGAITGRMTLSQGSSITTNGDLEISRAVTLTDSTCIHASGVIRHSFTAEASNYTTSRVESVGAISISTSVWRSSTAVFKSTLFADAGMVLVNSSMIVDGAITDSAQLNLVQGSSLISGTSISVSTTVDMIDSTLTATGTTQFFSAATLVRSSLSVINGRLLGTTLTADDACKITTVDFTFTSVIIRGFSSWWATTGGAANTLSALTIDNGSSAGFSASFTLALTGALTVTDNSILSTLGTFSVALTSTLTNSKCFHQGVTTYTGFVTALGSQITGAALVTFTSLPTFTASNVTCETGVAFPNGGSLADSMMTVGGGMTAGVTGFSANNSTLMIRTGNFTSTGGVAITRGRFDISGNFSCTTLTNISSELKVGGNLSATVVFDQDGANTVVIGTYTATGASTQRKSSLSVLGIFTASNTWDTQQSVMVLDGVANFNGSLTLRNGSLNVSANCFINAVLLGTFFGENSRVDIDGGNLVCGSTVSLDFCTLNVNNNFSGDTVTLTGTGLYVGGTYTDVGFTDIRRASNLVVNGSSSTSGSAINNSYVQIGGAATYTSQLQTVDSKVHFLSTLTMTAANNLSIQKSYFTVFGRLQGSTVSINDNSRLTTQDFGLTVVTIGGLSNWATVTGGIANVLTTLTIDNASNVLFVSAVPLTGAFILSDNSTLTTLNTFSVALTSTITDSECVNQGATTTYTGLATVTESQLMGGTTTSFLGALTALLSDMTFNGTVSITGALTFNNCRLNHNGNCTLLNLADGENSTWDINNGNLAVTSSFDMLRCDVNVNGTFSALSVGLVDSDMSVSSTYTCTNLTNISRASKLVVVGDVLSGNITLTSLSELAAQAALGTALLDSTDSEIKAGATTLTSSLQLTNSDMIASSTYACTGATILSRESQLTVVGVMSTSFFTIDSSSMLTQSTVAAVSLTANFSSVIFEGVPTISTIVLTNSHLNNATSVVFTTVDGENSRWDINGGNAPISGSITLIRCTANINGNFSSIATDFVDCEVSVSGTYTCTNLTDLTRNTELVVTGAASSGGGFALTSSKLLAQSTVSTSLAGSDITLTNNSDLQAGTTTIVDNLRLTDSKAIFTGRLTVGNELRLDTSFMKTRQFTLVYAIIENSSCWVANQDTATSSVTADAILTNALAIGNGSTVDFSALSFLATITRTAASAGNGVEVKKGSSLIWANATLEILPLNSIGVDFSHGGYLYCSGAVTQIDGSGEDFRDNQGDFAKGQAISGRTIYSGQHPAGVYSAVAVPTGASVIMCT